MSLNRHQYLRYCFLLCALSTRVSTAQADANCPVSGHPFARGHCFVTECPHGQWVRGSAVVKSDGRVEIRQGLETDHLTYGICGRVTFTFKDSSGKVIGTAQTGESCIPSKAPGNARIVESPIITQKIEAGKAASVASIETTGVCSREPRGIFGFTLDKIEVSYTWSL